MKHRRNAFRRWLRGNADRPAAPQRALQYLLLLVAAVLFLWPGYWLLLSAFKTQSVIFQQPLQFWPHPFVWQNFHDVFVATRLLRAFVNTTLIAVVQVALALFLCSLAGMAFARYDRAPGHKWLFVFVLGTMFIPNTVTMIPVFLLLTHLHLVNTYWAMILPGMANAFGIFWMRQYIRDNVPTELYEAARLDGASEFDTYWRVVVPIIKPALGALGVLVLITIWNNLMWAFVVLRTPNMYTMPLLIYLLQGDRNTPYGMLMAAGLVATLPLVLAFLFFQRWFIRGVAAGAVKT